MSASDGGPAEIDDGLAADPSPNSPAEIHHGRPASPRAAAADIDDDSLSVMMMGLGQRSPCRYPNLYSAKNLHNVEFQIAQTDRQTDRQ